MLRGRKAVAGLVIAAASAAVIGCGGDSEPEPSIPVDNAETLLATLEEIRANVDNGSCVVAGIKVQELQQELDELPADVNEDVHEALDRGSQNLLSLVEDPEQCEPRTETTTTETEPTVTTEPETTTERTQTEPTQPTQPTQPTTTQTQPTQPGDGGSGGISPGNPQAGL